MEPKNILKPGSLFRLRNARSRTDEGSTGAEPMTERIVRDATPTAFPGAKRTGAGWNARCLEQEDFSRLFVECR
jgi:hypothetical protein